jgi:spore germination protein YaaH
MMLRLYDRYYSKIGWTHAFYAVDAYGQKELLSGFDAVSYDWGRLECDAEHNAVLYTPASAYGNHVWPEGYPEVPALAAADEIPGNLNVYMTASQKVTLPDGTVTDACSAILLDETERKSAVALIMSRLVREGEGLYAGVTIDFEEMRGPALREGFNRFLEALDAALEQEGYALYVCVHPVTSDGIYYDAYDYKTIGALADKVILMAHDYAATALTPAEMDAGFTATPVTPFYEIYTALRAITDETTGVEDRSKIALAVSFGSIQWKTVDGKVINDKAYRPGPAAIAARMSDPAAVINYSEKYQNPYITYHNTEDNTDNIIWYEDARSVAAKAALARMFGIDGLSFWRLGLIPAAEDPTGRQIYYNIPAWLEANT